jgi:beta-phosphoglucomutase-like phosphatase (HAD superfamily)
MPGRFDLVIFDNDGVLVDSEWHANGILANLLGEAGIRPERCAVVEDSPHGVEAANRARMTAFGFARMMPAERLRHATGGVFSSMDELPGLLARTS